MFKINELINILALEQDVILAQTDGLTQADTLLQPQPGGNCMNWVLGHLLENQVSLLEVLGGASPLDATPLARYRRNSEPVKGTEADIMPLESLLNGHTLVHQAITDRLDKLTEADLDQETQFGDRLVKRSWYLLFMHFHYTYHVGQLEQLRQLAGRTEKVI
jgi:hypothetical protein